MSGRSLLAAFLLFPLTLSAPVAAQESQPGESCAGFAAGDYRRVGGPEDVGGGHFLVCDGTNWVSFLDYVDGGQVLTQIGDDPGACTAAKLGRLRYDSATETWEYCDNSTTWSGFGGGGGDNLGDHAATQNLNLGSHDIIGDNRLLIDGSLASGVLDDATSDAPYSRINVDSFHTQGIGAGQLFIEGHSIDGNGWVRIGVGEAGGQSASDVLLGDNDEIFVDTSTNSVGIGTASPSERLQVAGDVLIDGDGGTIGGTTLANGFLRIGASLALDPNEIYFNVGSNIGTTNSNPLTLRTNGTARIRVTSGGNVGVGTTSVSGGLKMDVEGRVGATQFCDNNGANCFNPSTVNSSNNLNCQTRSASITQSTTNVNCSSGYIVTGGGFANNNGVPQSRQSYPSSNTQWRCLTESPFNGTCYARCCRLQ